jgi:RHS repeat-associated protein
MYYNNRLQPCRTAVSSIGTAPASCGDGTSYGNVLDYTYNFNAGVSDNGNVIGITNNLTKYTSTDRSQQFTYDALNRIFQAGTVSTSGANCWGEQYNYDRWANLLSIGQWSPNYNGCTQESGFSITATANNQISGFCYDAAGNLLAYSPSPCTPVYTYNAENQLTSTAGVTYSYDADGKRVEKSNGTLYWYGTSGDPMVETDASGNLAYEYIFFDGKRIAYRNSLNHVNYYFANHLGSATVMTEVNGVACFATDYYPFGQERDNAQATNYLQESSEFDQSPWQNFDAGTPTITPDAATAPDGTATADKIAFPVGVNSRRVQDFNPVVPGGAAQKTFTFSIWMRVDAPLTVRFDLEDRVSGNYNHTSAIVNVTTQWQQFSVTRTMRAGIDASWAEIGNLYNNAVTTTIYVWGAQVSEATIGCDPSFKFTGKERDSESGLDNFGARYDSSLYGRFMTPDPIFASPAHLADPQMWNEYAYAGNNPLSITDPTGLDFYLTCDHNDDNQNTCHEVQNGSQKAWVQGTTDSSGSFTADRIANDANGNLVDINHDNAAYTGTFDVSGVHFSSANGSGNGQFIDGSNETDVNGGGIFSGLVGKFASDCGGSCQARGSLYELQPGSGALGRAENSLHQQSAFDVWIDGLSGAHAKGPQWVDGQGRVHVIQDESGPNAGKTELHFEGHPRDNSSLALHMVDTIGDLASGRAATEKNRPLP